ncbi:MAG: geranylgeranylglyceryl/heptaprenylglyceryl phosphate synthase [Salibacteraceae bacterium]
MTKEPFLNKHDRKLGVLIDPDKHNKDTLDQLLDTIHQVRADCILIGGSLVVNKSVDSTARYIKEKTHLPLVLFPGHSNQLTDAVDAVLLLSLISGRNPDLLIGQHVLAAPMLKKMSEKLVSTGYMLVDGGCPTSVAYMSGTQPIPADKPDIAVCTAIAGEAIGMKLMYLDAGSGARQQVPEKMVEAVAASVNTPLIVGGGVRRAVQIERLWNAGANLVVIGNALEGDSRTQMSADMKKHRNGI